MLIAIAIFCVLCEAVFTALEVALSTVSRARVRSLIEAETELEAETSRAETASATKLGRVAKPTRAARLLRLLEKPERLTIAFIIVTSLSLWTAASILTWMALDGEGWPRWSLWLSLLGVLFVAEVLPLLIAARNPEGVALRWVGVAEKSLLVLSPLIWLLGGVAHALARVFGVGPRANTQVTEGELRTALKAAEEEGVIQSDERALLESAMDFREKLVREVMTPRVDIVGVPAVMPLTAVLDVAMREGHSRVPVYDRTVDKIIGIVAAKDLIPHLRNGKGAPDLSARDVARPPYFVPENKRIAPTLEELRRQRTLMAIVVDADGGTAGLVTLEDLLEEIVGEIQDEYDQDEPQLRVVETAEIDDATPLVVTPVVVNASASDDSSPTAKRTAGEALVQGDENAPSVARIIAVDGGVSVRDAERFWQRSFGETLHLHNARGEDADDSLSMAALALQLFDGVPHIGDRVRGGAFAAGNSSPNSAAASGGEETSATTEPHIELHIFAMDGPRIEEIRLHKIG